MFCILLANLRKQVKTPYNLLNVNEHFENKPDAKRALLYIFLFHANNIYSISQWKDNALYPIVFDNHTVEFD